MQQILNLLIALAVFNKQMQAGKNSFLNFLISLLTFSHLSTYNKCNIGCLEQVLQIKIN